MAPIGAAGPQCLAGSPQQACHTEPHHQPKTAPTQHRAPLNTCLSGAQQAPRSAWSAPREVSHCLARASGNCATNCPALEASGVDIRGKPPIPPKGALMQSTDCVRSRLPKEAHKPDNTEVLVSKIEGAFRSLKRPMNYGFAVSAC